MRWDKKQQDVIELPCNTRALVDAGPGTGKTEVACGRVAWLIQNYNVNPGNIWLISFTRTAVQEIRNRISSFLDDEYVAYAVRIATLDSHAWKIHSGFDREAKLTGTYEENIVKLTQMIKNGMEGDIPEYLQTVQHLIVDEAQDFVGTRAELIIEIIDKLSDDCGVTVFSDEAQAIYGFSIDEDVMSDNSYAKTLPAKIREHYNGSFQPCQLTKVFRSRSNTLNGLFTGTRRKVMQPTNRPSQKHVGVLRDILKRADKKVPAILSEITENYPNNCFILYRTRAEVLIAASFFNEIPHRVRMSGLPRCIHPWLGACLSEHTETTLSKKKFIDYWDTNVENTPIEKIIDQDSAWNHLVRIAGKTRTVVDMKLLRTKLGNGKAPAELCYQEIGTSGPIISTIHASKGREAETIHLMIPDYAEFDDEELNDPGFEEETRVIFVGATRTRKSLYFGKGYRTRYSSRVHSSRRVYKNKGNGSAMVEIGHDGDISATGIAGLSSYSDESTILKNQKTMISIANKMTNASAFMDYRNGFVYRIKVQNAEEDIAVFSKNTLNKDLFEIANRIGGTNRRPPGKLNHLHIYGLRTIVLPPDSPECDDLHEPWATSGFMLAPIILGYSKGFFPEAMNGGK